MKKHDAQPSGTLELSPEKDKQFPGQVLLILQRYILFLDLQQQIKYCSINIK